MGHVFVAFKTEGFSRCANGWYTVLFAVRVSPSTILFSGGGKTYTEGQTEQTNTVKRTLIHYYVQSNEHV